MRSNSIVALFCGAFLIAAFVPHRLFAADSCITCHKTLSTESSLGHSFADWENSIHQKNGISCHNCHGGNPSATDKSGAHIGIQPSTQKGSPLYFTNIPETCGQCHSDIFKAFKKSAHFKELNQSGRGPNCLTCHGSMATWVLHPDQMEQTCTLCHQKPMQAQAALMSLSVARSTVDKLAATTPMDPKQKLAVDALKSDLTTTIELWHTFDMPKVLDESRKLIKKARELSTDWKLQMNTMKKEPAK